MPELNLPEDFENILVNNTIKNETSNSPAKRKKRASSTSGSIFQVVGSNGLDTADVYMGFNLDGLRVYQNISSSLPNLQFHFYPPPVIPSITNVINIDLNDPKILNIKVICFNTIFRHYIF